MLATISRAETSAQIRERVTKARVIQIERFKDGNAASAKKLGGSATYCGGNAHMNHRQIKQYCALDEECKKLLKMAIDELGLSARGYDKILKISRTIADLAVEETLRS